MRSRAEHDLCLLARSSSPAWQCLLVRGSSPVRRAHVLSHRGGPDCGTHQAEVNALDSQRVGGHHVALLHLLRGHLVHRPALRQRRCKRTPTLVRPSARRLASKQAGSGSGQPHLQRLLWTRLRLPRPISLPRLLGRAGRPCRPCFCHDRRLQLCAELGEDDAVLATPPEVGSVRLASQRRGSAQCRGGQGAASAARPCHLGGERCHGNCTPKKQRTRQLARASVSSGLLWKRCLGQAPHREHGLGLAGTTTIGTTCQRPGRCPSEWHALRRRGGCLCCRGRVALLQ